MTARTVPAVGGTEPDDRISSSLNGRQSAVLAPLLGAAAAIVLTALAVTAAWNLERVREGIGASAPYLPIALYLTVPLSILAAAIEPTLHRSVRGSGLESFARMTRGLAFPLALTTAMIAYLVPLVASWERGYRAYLALGGVVPWSDAGGYYRSALGVLLDNDLSDWGSRRPLAIAFLAVRLAMTNLDLRLALVLQAAALGAACYLAARVVARDLGRSAGLALFAALFGFAAFGVETTMSEPFGVTLAALAFAALWNAVRARNVALAAAGLFLLTLAISARAGAYLVLVVLAVWFARLLRREGTVIDRRTLLLGFGAVAGGLVANSLLVVVLHGDVANTNGQFSSTLYGLAKGNEGWTAARADFPEISSMSNSERNRFVMRKSLEQIREEPGRLALGLWRSGTAYFEASYNLAMTPVGSRLARIALSGTLAALTAAFIAVRWRSSGRRALLGPAFFGAVVLAIPVLTGLWARYPAYPRWFPLILVLIAYAATVVARPSRLPSGPWVSFMLTAFAGIAVSLPLLPLRDGGVRFQAAVAPFFALSVVPIAVVCAQAAQHVAVDCPMEPSRPLRFRGWSPAAAGVLLVAVILLGTPLAQALVSRPEVVPRRCPDGSRARAFTGIVAVEIVGNEPGAEDELDQIDLVSISPEVLTRWSVEIIATLRSLEPGTMIAQGYSQSPGGAVLIIEDPTRVSGREVLYLCGNTVEDPGSLHKIFVGRPLDG